MNKFLILIVFFNLAGCDVGSKSKESKDSESLTRPTLGGEGGLPSDSDSTSSNPEISSDVDPVPEAPLDSDFDGVSDNEEIVNNEDPNISYFPVVSIANSKRARISSNYSSTSTGDSKEISINYTLNNYSERESDFNGKGFLIRNKIVQDKISSVVYSYIFDTTPSIELMPAMKDALLGEFGCISTVEYFKKYDEIKYNVKDNDFFSNTLDFQYGLYFQNVKGVKTIELVENNFNLKSSFNDIDEVSVPLRIYHSNFEFGVYNHQTFAEQFISKVSFTDQATFLNSPSLNECVYMGSSDFNYERLGRKLRFSQVLSDIENETAHIYFSANGKTYLFNVAPKAFSSIKSFLESLDLSVSIDKDNKLSKVDHLENELVENLHIDNIKDDLLDKGRWNFISSTGSRIIDPLQSGQSYIIAHRKLSELVRNSNFSQGVVEEANLANFTVSNAYVGDELLIFSELYGSLNLPGPKVTLMDGEKSELECDFVGQRRHCSRHTYTVKNGCSISEVNTDLSLANMVQETPAAGFNIVVGERQRAIAPALVTRNGLYFRVKISEADLNNKKIQIRIGNQQLNKQFPYVRKFSRRNHGGGFCKDKVKDWTEGRSANKTYFLKSKIIRNGVIR